MEPYFGKVIIEAEREDFFCFYWYFKDDTNKLNIFTGKSTYYMQKNKMFFSSALLLVVAIENIPKNSLSHQFDSLLKSRLLKMYICIGFARVIVVLLVRHDKIAVTAQNHKNKILPSINLSVYFR